MSVDIMAAIYARWNAAGLNTSIAELYPAGEGTKASQNKAGSPEGDALPRAEYYATTPAPSQKTRGSRVHQSMAVITVRDKTNEAAVGTFVKNIRAAFVNSESAGTSPMTMTGGTVLEVDDGGSLVVKVDDDVFLGQQQLLIRHRIANVTPA